MTGGHGQFCWYELLTTDTGQAADFYREVVGWTVMDAGHGTMPYSFFVAGDTPVAGLMTLPEEASDAGARPGWMGYIAVEDVDGTADRVTALGGVQHRPAADIPEVGRFAVMADPQGASFVLFKAAPGQVRPSLPAGTPGHAGWRELMATDWEKAFAFYADVFGWTKDLAVDMGPMGVYQLFAIDGVAAGGMMNRPPNVPVSFWKYYFQVDGIEAAAARVKAAGGTVLHGPHQVPGGSWILQGLDQQGALFALTSAS